MAKKQEEKIKTEHIISALIGYWRMGAKMNEMEWITGLDKDMITGVIIRYQVSYKKNMQ